MLSPHSQNPTLLDGIAKSRRQVRFESGYVAATPKSVAPIIVRYPEPPFDSCLLDLSLRKDPSLRNIIDDPAKCAIRVRDLEDLLNVIKPDMTAYCDAHSVDDAFHHVCHQDSCPFDHKGVPHVNMDRAVGDIKPLSPNMHLVVSRYVKPWTRKTNVSYAGALIAIQAARADGTPPDMKAHAFISHNWEELFDDFVTTALNALDRDSLIWVCSFLINQNADIGKALGTDLREVPFARALKRADLVINFMDGKAMTLSRAWVVFETYLALTDPRGISFHVALPNNSNREAWDLVSQKLQDLDVRHCQASIPSDHAMIMKLVAGNEDKLNSAVKATIGHACLNAGALEAARSGNLEALKSHPNPLCHDAGFTSVLHYAAESARVDVIVYLIELRAHVDQKNKDGDSALHFAARNGCNEGCLILLKAGAEISIRNNTGATPLHAATEVGDTEMANALIELSSDVNVVDHEGMTPLHYTAMTGQVDVAAALLGAIVDSRNKLGRTPLHFAAFHGKAYMAETLLHWRATVDAEDKNGETALHCAAYCNRMRVAEELICASADIHAKTKSGWSPLHWAAYEGFENMVFALLERGSSIDAKTRSWRSALHIAASNGHDAVVTVLSKQGADVSVIDGSGKTALHWAATNGHESTVSKLVKLGVPIDACDSSGRTALHAAAGKGNTEVVATLIMLAGAVNITDSHGRTPYQEAEHNGHLETMEKLEALGAEVVISSPSFTSRLRYSYTMQTDMNARVFRAGRRERESEIQCILM